MNRNSRMLISGIFCFFPWAIQMSCASLSSEQVFTNIYEQGVWGGQWYSGGGSEIQYARKYVDFLQNFLKEHDIRSVVDVGCGDWQFSRYIDWSGIEYLGLDVVLYLIERNQERFQTSHIQFRQYDVLQEELPEADLLLCKDVLQHLTNDDVRSFVRQLSRFKHCLITNDINSTAMSLNSDIVRGKFRPIDLRREPFYIQAKAVFIYEADCGNVKMVLHIKQ